jgi:hypothetical protein
MLMAWQRFCLTRHLALEQPWPSGHRRQFDEGQPVLSTPRGRI